MSNKFSPAKRGATISTIALAFSAALPAQAQQTVQQQSEVEALRALIGDLQARLTKLEETQSAATAAAKTAPKPVTSRNAPVTISGLLQTHALGYFSQKGPGARVSDTFRLRRGEIRLTAPITTRLTGTVMIDPAKNLTQNAAGAINQSSNIFQELALQYQLKKTATSSHFIDIGQFKIPIGYEGDQVSSGQLQFVERALIFAQRDIANGGYGDIRESGVRLRGTSGEIGYDLGVFNGFGERQNALAATDQKAVIGRLFYRPKSVEGLVLGVSGGTGSAGGFDRNVLNAFAAFKKDKWTLQSEYLDGKAQGPLGTPPVATLRDIKGYYGSVGYLFTPRIEGTFRYDYFDTDTALANADAKDITLGANYYLKGHNAKIQLNLVRRDGNPGARTGNGANDLRNDRYELRTNFQVAF